MSVVELLDEREGLSFVLGGEDCSQLGGEGGVVGGFRKGGAEERFGLGILFARDQNVGQTGVGGCGFWVAGEDAGEDTAVGCLRSVELSRLIGEAGSQEGVGWGLGSELQGL